MVKSLTQLAADILPTRIKSVISPVYQKIRGYYYCARIELGYGNTSYLYDSEKYSVEYTIETAHQLNTLVRSEKMRFEQVPLEYIESEFKLDSFIDIGAHFGTYSIVGSHLNPDADIFSFEPSDYNRGVLEKVLEKNNISADIRKEVVTDYTGEIDFYMDESQGSESHSISKNSVGDKVTKPCVSISDFVGEREMEKVFIKIDAEGGEKKILQDICTLSNVCIEGIVEFHPDKLDGDYNRFLSNMKDQFQVFNFIIDSSPNHPNAEQIPNDNNRPVYYYQIDK